MNACDIIWRAAGCPPSGRPVEPHDGLCAVCGIAVTEGVPGKHAFGANFGSRGELKSGWSTHACEACSWVLSGKPPKTIRLWTVVYRADVLASPSNPKAPDLGQYVHLTGKNDLSLVVSTLLDPPKSQWVVSVASSGQKHVLPFARVNCGSSWVVRFEAVDVCSDSGTFARVLYSTTCLLVAGFYRSEIESRQPAFSRLSKHIDLWRLHDALLQPFRTSPLFDLALFCCTKEHTHDHQQSAARTLDRFGLDRPRDPVRVGDTEIG